MLNLISFSLLLLANTPARIWYSVPLIVVISLVYGATRHERLKEIVENAVRTTIWVLAFMGLIFLMIWATGFLI